MILCSLLDQIWSHFPRSDRQGNLLMQTLPVNHGRQGNLPAKFLHVNGFTERIRGTPSATVTSGDLDNLQLSPGNDFDFQEVSNAPNVIPTPSVTSETSAFPSDNPPVTPPTCRPSLDTLLSFRQDEEAVKASEKRVLSHADRTIMANIKTLPKSVRIAVAKEYEGEFYVVNIPKIDNEWKNFLIFDWPESAKLPEDPRILAKFNQDFPGLAADLDLVDRHRQRQLEIAPLIRGLNNLFKVYEFSEETDAVIEKLLFDDKTGTVRAMLDSIQLMCDHIAKINQARRENFLSLFPPLQSHIMFSRDPSNYNMEELREGLFGKTFIEALKEKVTAIKEGLQSFSSAQFAAKKMIPTRQNPPSSRKENNTGKSYSNKPTRYVSLPACNTFSCMNLEPCSPPFPFININGINHLGGRLFYFLPNWRILTSNPSVLNIVAGHKINFFDFPPSTQKILDCTQKLPPGFIEKMLSQRVIEPATELGILSPFFVIPKPSGDSRFILNLKNVNQVVTYKHFKMQNVTNALDLINQGDFLIKIDLQSAYDCVPIYKPHRQFLQFSVANEVFQFTCFPNGLSEAPRLFTLLLDPIKFSFGKLGIKFISYLDDLLVMHNDPLVLKNQASLIVSIFINLGFLINITKSEVVPVNSLIFLGFCLDTIRLRISLPIEKLEKIICLAEEIISKKSVSRRKYACTLGKMTSATLAVQQGPLHFRNLQYLVNQVEDPSNWETVLDITPQVRADLEWWMRDAKSCLSAPFHPPQPDLSLHTDASLTGWGAHLSQNHAQGKWTSLQRRLHINVLELLAIHYGLLSLCQGLRNVCILIQSDNMTALSYISKKGGTRSQQMCNIALDCWDWAVSRGITLITAHIPGIENSEADTLSRQFQDPADWMLNPQVFSRITKVMGKVTLDLFANLWNRQVPRFYAWKPQPHAIGLDSLAHPWPLKGGYAFPPWILIPKIIQKIRREGVEVILIAPIWPKTCWYSHLVEMSIQHPLLLPQTQILTDAEGNPPQLKAHLRKNFALAAWKLSGNTSLVREFQNGCKVSFASKTGTAPLNYTNIIGKSGVAGVLPKGFLQFLHL